MGEKSQKRARQVAQILDPGLKEVVDHDDFLSISTSNGLIREMATGCGVEPAAIHIIKQI